MFRGNAYDTIKNYDEAIRDLNKAIELDSQNSSFYYFRGVAYYHKEKYNEALRDFNKAAERLISASVNTIGQQLISRKRLNFIPDL
jgi:tetratricopeptide (TPR) repeat protein